MTVIEDRGTAELALDGSGVESLTFADRPLGLRERLDGGVTTLVEFTFLADDGRELATRELYGVVYWQDDAFPRDGSRDAYRVTLPETHSLIFRQRFFLGKRSFKREDPGEDPAVNAARWEDAHRRLEERVALDRREMIP